MTAITNPAQVRDTFPGSIAETDDWLDGRIEAAERILAARVPGRNLAAWAERLDRAPEVREVVARMVLRLVRAGSSGLVQQSEAIGPTSYSVRADPRAIASTLWVTEDEWRLLGLGRRGAFTIHSRIGQ